MSLRNKKNALLDPACLCVDLELSFIPEHDLSNRQIDFDEWLKLSNSLLSKSPVHSKNQRLYRIYQIVQNLQEAVIQKYTAYKTPNGDTLYFGEQKYSSSIPNGSFTLFAEATCF